MISSDEEGRNLSLRDRWEMFLESAAKIDWKRGPTFRHEKYAYNVLGFELTWLNGFGIGLGLGSLDIWVGWPRKAERVHYKGCGHKDSLGIPYQNPKPKELVKA